MCLITFDWQPLKETWLTLAANRDEFYQRPTAPLQIWVDEPDVAGGRDLSQGGSWLAFSRSGRFAALTNVRAPGAGPADPVSRGQLVSGWLTSKGGMDDFIAALTERHHLFAPFNLLLGQRDRLLHISNHPQLTLTDISPGIHGLSNAALDTPWPKTRLACQQLSTAGISSGDALARLLSRRERFSDEELPATGVPLEWERRLSAQFIVSPGYGTRCSTGVVADGTGFHLTEIQWNEQGTEGGINRLVLPVQS